MTHATLLALVGPSGAGKTTLARALQAAGFGRIATTTTRQARIDEVVGRDLYTVSNQQFNQLRTSNAIIAICEYSSASYGVQVQHLKRAAETVVPQIIIVEPSGIAALKSWAAAVGIRFTAVFVTLSTEAVRERIENRYANETGREAERDDRLDRALSEVNQWRNAYLWDLVVDSGDKQLDLELIIEMVTRPDLDDAPVAACA